MVCDCSYLKDAENLNDQLAKHQEEIKDFDDLILEMMILLVCLSLIRNRILMKLVMELVVRALTRLLSTLNNSCGRWQRLSSQWR